jgi:UrcA family protein
MLKLSSRLGPIGAVCGLAVLAVGAPAVGQTPPEEFAVVAQAAGPHDRSLSAAVFYGDLDLATPDGRAALRRRIRRTASELCHRLDSGPSNATGLAFVCEDEAVQGADEFQRAVIAQAAPRSDQAMVLQARRQR